MQRVLAVFLVTLAIVNLNAGCSRIAQKNIDGDTSSIVHPGGGMIVGSVTAPKVLHYHKTAVLRYRALSDDGKPGGVLTSGRTPGWQPTIPKCAQDGLEQECGRLFAVSLPAGRYEIFEVSAIPGNESYKVIPPLRFTVLEGKVAYLGNLHVVYCHGSFHSMRGGILGGDISIRDELDRDAALLKSKYTHLNGVDIDKRLLPATSSSWRVSYEPYDWGTCRAPATNSLDPDLVK